MAPQTGTTGAAHKHVQLQPGGSGGLYLYADLASCRNKVGAVALATGTNGCSAQGFKITDFGIAPGTMDLEDKVIDVEWPNAEYNMTDAADETKCGVGPALYTYYDALHVRQSKERTCRHQCPQTPSHHPLNTPCARPEHALIINDVACINHLTLHRG